MQRYDVAISFSSEDDWIAKDIHTLMNRYGVSCYCSKNERDAASGNLHESLREIYRTSLLNVLVYSQAYSSAPSNSTIAMELEELIARHTSSSSDRSLYVLLVDIDKPPVELTELLHHRLKDVGITGAERHILDRQSAQKVATPIEGVNFVHPKFSLPSRGSISACKFTIFNNYQGDERWSTLGDIRVDVIEPRPELNRFGLRVYLIPSDFCITELNHSTRLRIDPALLEKKKNYGAEFCARHRSTALFGGLFAIKKTNRDLPTVYCKDYDEYLNSSWNASRYA
jgi:hypothetical protein